MDKKTIFKMGVFFTVSCLIPACIEKFYYVQEAFSFDRFIIFSVILIFISLHFIFDIKKLWDQIYRKRYVIGILLFVFIVANGYNGSSMSIYNGAVQGEVPVENGDPILGKPRLIRGDEWAVGTPTLLSQDLPINNYGVINHSMMATELNTTFYLKKPCKDISILTTPSHLGFLFLPRDNAFSFSWYLYMFIVFFALFELLMIITKKNRMLSLLGTIMVTFSPVAQWWTSFNLVGFGSVAVVLFYYYLKSEKWKIKIPLAAAIGYAGACYVMILYPAWMVTYAYFFLMIVIWMIYKNKGRNTLKEYIVLIAIVISVMLILIAPSFINGRDVLDLVSNTVYPGARSSIGGYGWEKMFKYPVSFFTPFSEAPNASEMSQYVSLYPLPMIVGLVQWFKNYRNKKHDLLLSLLLFVSIFLNIWNFVAIPEIVAKVTMLSMSTVERCVLVVGFINIILLIKLLSDYATEKKSAKNMIISVAVAGGFALFTIYQCTLMYPDYMTFNKSAVAFVAVFLISALFLINTKKTKPYLMVSLIVLTLATGVVVHPVNKGLAALYEKPIAKEVQQITKKDPYSKWLAISTPYYLQNYALANGARMINSVNPYPNYEFWNIVDPEKEYEDMYNRFAHLSIELINGKSEASLLHQDHVSLKLDANLLKEIDVQYILSALPLNQFKEAGVEMDEIYNEYGLFVYKMK